MRTIFNAFHHLGPAVASAVLADAAAQRQPIVTFELVERGWQGAFIAGTTPIAIAGLMPFVRPRRLANLALTYAFPVLAAAIAWDGFASCLRAYSVDELEAMIAPLQRADYRFRVVRQRMPWRPVFMTCLVGVPT